MAEDPKIDPTQVREFSEAVNRYQAPLQGMNGTPVKVLSLLAGGSVTPAQLIERMRDGYGVAFLEVARAVASLAAAGYIMTEAQGGDETVSLTSAGEVVVQHPALVSV